MTVINDAADAHGTTCAGSVLLGVHFRSQQRDGQSCSSSTVFVPPKADRKVSLDLQQRKLTAASLALAHHVSKKGYNAFYAANMALPASYDTVMSEYRSFIEDTVRALYSWCHLSDTFCHCSSCNVLQAAHASYGLLRTHVVSVDISDLPDAAAQLGDTIMMQSLDPVDALVDALVTARTSGRPLAFDTTPPYAPYRTRTCRVGGLHPAPPLRGQRGQNATPTKHSKWMKHLQRYVCPLTASESWHEAASQTIAAADMDSTIDGSLVRGTRYADGCMHAIGQQKARDAGAEYGMGIAVFADECITDERGHRSLLPVCVSTPLVAADSGANLTMDGRTVSYFAQFEPTDTSESQRKQKYEVIQRQLKELLKLCARPEKLTVYLPATTEYAAQLVTAVGHVSAISHDLHQAWESFGLLKDSCPICMTREVKSCNVSSAGCVGHTLHHAAMALVEAEGEAVGTCGELLVAIKQYDLHATSVIREYYSAAKIALHTQIASVPALIEVQPLFDVDTAGVWRPRSVAAAGAAQRGTFFNTATQNCVYRTGQGVGALSAEDKTAAGAPYNPQVLDWLTQHSGVVGGLASACDLLHTFDAGILQHVFDSIMACVHADSVECPGRTVDSVRLELRNRVSQLRTQQQDGHSIRGCSEHSTARILGGHKRRGVEYRDVVVWLAALIQDAPTIIANSTQRNRIHWLLAVVLEIQDILYHCATISLAQLSQLREKIALLQTLYALAFPTQLHGKPKWHAVQHIIEAYIMWGSPRNVTTAPMEKMHSMACSAVYQAGNKHHASDPLGQYVRLLVAYTRMGAETTLICNEVTAATPPETVLAACLLVLTFLRSQVGSRYWLPGIADALVVFSRLCTQDDTISDTIHTAAMWLRSNASPKMTRRPSTAQSRCDAADVLDTALDMTEQPIKSVVDSLPRLRHRPKLPLTLGTRLLQPIKHARWQDKYRQKPYFARSAWALHGTVRHVCAEGAEVLNTVPQILNDDLVQAMQNFDDQWKHIYVGNQVNNAYAELTCSDYSQDQCSVPDLFCYVSMNHDFPLEIRPLLVLGFITGMRFSLKQRSQCEDGAVFAICRVAQPTFTHSDDCPSYRHATAAPSFFDMMLAPAQSQISFNLHTKKICLVPVTSLSCTVVASLHASIPRGVRPGRAQRLPSTSANAASIRFFIRVNAPCNTHDRKKVNGKRRTWIRKQLRVIE